jgi:hypothetical protein
MMKTIDSTPLGFSDLTNDEAFVVSVFRHWQYCAPACDEADRSLINMLSGDRLYDGVQPLLDLFKALPEWHRRKTRNDSSVLTSIEEALLDEIGTVSTATNRCVKAFQQVLMESGTAIRPASEIPRSGHDQLLEVINKKTTQVLETLYPDFLGSTPSS